jgi:hypothetical protein
VQHRLDQLSQLIVDNPRLAHARPNETDLRLVALICIDSVSAT